ncbi:lipoprotein-releasing ABC transporter permease subunit [Pleionea mediterranea]|jgi:lipoprotein-releasing system permease protein|uniref:Lipoprotein-releasing system permease protein n=1 Tax=Pleionea mediterranea TaxID=523701 RepID=A0A316FTB2_9GAMM|nr:lipoprotein-releasing ABC transporter permease subunit [Pleionea mediterranea]PWK50946.1 lipoprotein-releasing system permease protein [Pleionea mediterranea]
MKFPFSWFIGLRYTRAKRKNHFISFIALASMLGIALGVMVLITVMSVMNGFERELKERILGTVPHIIVGERGDGVKDWQALEQRITEEPTVVAVSPYIDSTAMFKSAYGGTEYGILQGIMPDREKQVSVIEDYMVTGSIDSLAAGEYGVVIGTAMAKNLGLWQGDKITVLVVEGSTVSPAGISPRYRRFTIQGLFETKSELDSRVALIHIGDAAKLLRKQDTVSALRIKVDDVLRAHVTSTRIRAMLGLDYWVSDWNRTQGPLFRAIQMEKNMMFILLTLIIAVAAFNIVSTMVMVVTDKQSDIAIMRTLGASPATVMKVFMVQGSVNGVFGTILGVISGVALATNLPDIVAWVETQFGIAMVPGDVYFIGFLPSELQSSDVVNITLAALGMSVLATLYPAWRASRTRPAEALKYE